MKPLFYIMKKNIKNTGKELLKRPWTLVAYVILVLIIIFSLVMGLWASSNNNIAREGSLQNFQMLITIFLLGVFYFSIKQGIDSGSSFFRKADINYVFTAPLSSNKILMYGFIKQTFSILTVFFFITAQIPNLSIQFGVDSDGIVVIYIGCFLLFLLMPLIGMLIYSVASATKRNRAIFDNVLKAVVVILVMGVIYQIYITKDFMKAANIILNNSLFTYLPVIGWFKVFLSSAVQGLSTSTYLNLGLIIVTYIVVVLAIYKLKSDFYEDVLVATDRKEALISAKKQGKGNMQFYSAKIKKANIKYKGSGAKTIFYRHLLEYKKTGFFFIDKSTLIVAAFSIISKYAFSNADIKITLYFSIYLMFFITLNGKWQQELEKPFIYLLPASTLSKVFYATLSTIIKSAVDGIVLFTIAGFLFKSDLGVILLSVAAYTSYASVYVYSDVLFRRIFGVQHAKQLLLLLKMLLTLFVIVPGLIISIVSAFIFRDTVFGLYSSYGILVIYNVVVSTIALLLSKGMFEKIEIQ